MPNSPSNNKSANCQPYSETAYKGKQDPIYRNMAQPEERKGQSMLARDQCKRDVFPRGYIYGICWDFSQRVPSRTEDLSDLKHANIKERELRLPLASTGNATVWDAILLMWQFFTFISFLIVPGFYIIVVALVFITRGFLDALDTIVEGLPFISYWIFGLIILKLLYLFIYLFIPKPIYKCAMFNRSTGNIEFPTADKQSFIALPFEQFNAHHRTVHTANGVPQYGFTLLHYQQGIMYQNISGSDVYTIHHWEMIQNFMDITQPLADIPNFEYYRIFDKTTCEFDKQHNRPRDFWYRVTKKQFKNVFTNNEDRNDERITYPWKFLSKELSEIPIKRKGDNFIMRHLPLLLPIHH
ncbi:hypothetical protein [Pseudoalteromonas denitrificans]|uniref:Uncharacterized protein n=1 Tax=Pseudoalteromonas denitrificans DSM 6059 TaxID=1123010 RepID=A0A1I1NFI4_9GAMM|nr:hypothetical protein [Pseudoalteromonas denitrificans]SFC96022.1 hypothetical protein SAMN02745724_03046 [Pseudoalteromonas denitrificans DSM 6059]